MMHVMRAAALLLLVSVLLVGVQPVADASAATTALPATHAERSSRPGARRAGAVIDGSYIVRFRDPTGTARAAGADQAIHSIRDHGATVDHAITHVFPGAVVHATAAQAEALRQDPTIASVDADHVVTEAATQTGAPWGLDRSDQRALPLSTTFTSTTTAAGVTAYVVDTGIRNDHVDLAGRVRDGFTAFAGDYADCEGHGTHVAGILGGSHYGVAKGVSLVNVRVLGCDGSGADTDVITALDWIIGDHVAGQPAVANLSLAGDPDPRLDAAIDSLIADGVSVVVAAGNNGANACDYSPASSPGAITVGATTSYDDVASYSNTGTCVDLFAPGDQITSDWNTSATATATISGTSMASPLVAGAAAVLLAGHPTMAPAAVAATMVGDATTGVVTNPGVGSPNRLLFIPAFSDVAPGSTFDAEIGWMLQHGITTGYADGTYHPLESVDRQAMAAFLYRDRASPLGPPPTCTTAPFPDVPITSPFCGEIAWMANQGITTGFADGGFHPAAPVERQAMAAFLYRVRQPPNGPRPTCASAPFTDVATDARFCGEIAWMKANQITTGFPDGSFHPIADVERQAMAAFLNRLGQ